MAPDFTGKPPDRGTEALTLSAPSLPNDSGVGWLEQISDQRILPVRNPPLRQ